MTACIRFSVGKEIYGQAYVKFWLFYYYYYQNKYANKYKTPSPMPFRISFSVNEFKIVMIMCGLHKVLQLTHWLK